MADFQKPINDRDLSPIIVPPIEKDRRAGEELFSPFSNTLFFAAFLLKLKKFLHSFASQTHTRSAQIDQAQILEDLRSFKAMLQILEEEDRSHLPDFLLQLSEKWHHLLEDSKNLAEVEKKYPIVASQIKLFMLQVLSFPQKQEHSLGYYLTESAGKDWIPFPFMDILQLLVQEHQQNPEKSQLKAWINMLDNIMTAYQ